MRRKGTVSAKRVLGQLVFRYFDHNVGKNAAALAYYLLFALFPLLIFVSNLLGLLELDVYSVTQALGEILPDDIVRLIETYLGHVSRSSNHTLMWFSLIFSIWFPTRAVKGLTDDVRRAYGLGDPAHPLAYTVKQVLYTAVFVAVILLTLILCVAGETLVRYVGTQLPAASAVVDGVLRLWRYLRFFLVALLMFVAIGALYAMATERRLPIKQILPGIALALLSWLIVSIGFAFYVENVAQYSVIYGALGAVIVLLLWLYMTAMLLILGAELNAVLALPEMRGATTKGEEK